MIINVQEKITSLTGKATEQINGRMNIMTQKSNDKINCDIAYHTIRIKDRCQEFINIKDSEIAGFKPISESTFYCESLFIFY